MKAIAVVSGGMDSVTAAHLLSEQGYLVDVLAFNYGQRHSKELLYSKMCADDLGSSFNIIDLSCTKWAFGGSALTDDIQVPDGHYAADNMRATIVPNRNAVMLSIAYSVAVLRNADAVCIGVHSGDHPIYPDCRPEFVAAFESAMIASTGRNIQLLAPFINKTKADIISCGSSIGVDYRKTWSCYRGLDLHCGTCGTCTERIEAFQLANTPDPTKYMRKP